MAVQINDPRVLDGEEKDIAVQQYDGQGRGYAMDESGVELNLKDAIAAERADHQETVWQAVKKHPTSVGWSLVMSLLVIGESLTTFRGLHCTHLDPRRGFRLGSGRGS